MILDTRNGVHVAGVFVVMTVKTEVFPVAAIGRIVVVVMIFMVDGEFVQVLPGELTSSSPAYPGMNF